MIKNISTITMQGVITQSAGNGKQSRSKVWTNAFEWRIKNARIYGERRPDDSFYFVFTRYHEGKMDAPDDNYVVHKIRFGRSYTQSHLLLRDATAIAMMQGMATLLASQNAKKENEKS